MNIDYIIVQAGGKGTRLKQLTQNKPKALVPVNNLPMLFHLFRKYPDKKYIIIGDYQKNVFRKYLRVFAEVKYLFVETSGTGKRRPRPGCGLRRRCKPPCNGAEVFWRTGSGTGLFPYQCREGRPGQPPGD